MVLQDLQATLDAGHKLPPPDGILINGRGSGATINVEQGKFPLRYFELKSFTVIPAC